MPANLSVDEKINLSQLESRIEKGFKHFYEACQALKVIRDRRLYRERHTTFEAYCEERWGVGKSQAYRLIDAAELLSDFSPIGEVLPQSEYQARALRMAEPEEREPVWEAAVSIAGGQPTHEQIKEVIRVRQQQRKQDDCLEVGAEVSIVDEDHPHYRQSFKITEVDRAVVHLETPEGPKPFLRSAIAPISQAEIDAEPAAPSAPRVAAPPKLNPIEKIDMDRRRLAQRVELLESLLRDLRSRILLPADLSDRINRLLEP